MKIKREFKQGTWLIQLSYKGVIYQAMDKSHNEAMKQVFKLVEIEGIN